MPRHLATLLMVAIVITATRSAAEPNGPDSGPENGNRNAKLRLTIPENVPILSERAIQFINHINTTWKAGRNFDRQISEKYLIGLLGVKKSANDPKLPLYVHDEDVGDDIPAKFDSRTAWPQCPKIGLIRDQGSCGSCWAIAAAEAMSDRICIASNGTDQPKISTRNLLSCCAYCGEGCQGGAPSAAWRYYQKSGIVSGGLWHSNEGCQPYPVEACEHHVTGKRKPCGEIIRTPPCVHSCRPGYDRSYDEDKHYASRAYSIRSNVRQIQREIMTHGPVEADFSVYSDFFNYRSGIYQRHSDNMLGGHAIRIIGWGAENGIQYWLCANSWNTDWGENGFFRIRHGECGIESDIVTGLPKIDSDSDSDSDSD